MIGDDDILAEFERRVVREYLEYIRNILWANGSEDMDIDKMHSWEIFQIGRNMGIVLKWSQKGVRIVHEDETVKSFRNPYGS